MPRDMGFCWSRITRPGISNQNQLHVHIGSLVWGGDYAVGIDVLESHGLVQPNRGRQHVVGLQIESLGARISPLIDRCMKQPATDASSLVRRLDSRLGHLK